MQLIVLMKLQCTLTCSILIPIWVHVVSVAVVVMTRHTAHHMVLVRSIAAHATSVAERVILYGIIYQEIIMHGKELLWFHQCAHLAVRLATVHSCAQQRKMRMNVEHGCTCSNGEMIPPGVKTKALDTKECMVKMASYKAAVLLVTLAASLAMSPDGVLTSRPLAIGVVKPATSSRNALLTVGAEVKQRHVTDVGNLATGPELVRRTSVMPK